MLSAEQIVDDILLITHPGGQRLFLMVPNV